MAVDEKHPLYADFQTDWVLVQDAYKGQRTVKEKRTIYLPPTSGMEIDGLQIGQPGRKAYDAYLQRAVFPGIMTLAVRLMIGVLHSKPAKYQLPSRMEPLLDSATNEKESLATLHRKINEHQLITGRCGLLVDIPERAPVSTLPYIALYRGDHIINWDAGNLTEEEIENLNLVVLDESGWRRLPDLTWEQERRHRLLFLGNLDQNETGPAAYQMATYVRNEIALPSGNFITPSLGGKTLDFIPFTFINANDVVPDPEEPPLLDVANIAMQIYRMEADYRQALFMQGQDTLVVIGSTEKEFAVGANRALALAVGGDAKYIGPDSSGIPEMRSALENDYARASERAGQLTEAVSRERESGEALKVRVGARTATLNQVARAGAFGLQQALRHVAVWMGENPEDVIVEPNMDFAEASIQARELVDFMAAKGMGFPISLRSLHAVARNRELTEMEFEEELDEIDSEEPLVEGTEEGGNEPGSEQEA